MQPLGLVNRHNLHHLGVALQPQQRVVSEAIDGFQRLFGLSQDGGEGADEFIGVTMSLGQALQPLGQMQPVGQAALAGRRCQSPLRKPLLPDEVAHRGEHSVRAPAGGRCSQSLDAGVPQGVVVSFCEETAQFKPHGGAGPDPPGAGEVAGAAHGQQQVEKVPRLRRLKNGVTLGEVDAGQSLVGQCAADRLGLCPVAHQNAEVLGPQTPEPSLCIREAHAWIAKHSGHLTGRPVGISTPTQSRATGLSLGPDPKSRHLFLMSDEGFFWILRVDSQERDIGPMHECATRIAFEAALLCPAEQVIDGLNQSRH